VTSTNTDETISKAIIPAHKINDSGRVIKAADKPKAKFPKGGIGPQFVNRYMHKFEQYWHANGEYPNDTWIIAEFGFTLLQVQALNNSKFWLQSLDRRGIRRPSTDQSKLSPEQVAAIAVITNYSDRRPVPARLEAMGVSQEILHGWQSDPAFKKELTERAADTFRNVAPVAEIRLAQAVERGNLNAIKFYFEVTGKAETPETINVKRALQTIIEAVQKHCSQDQLEAIQSEVNSVLGMQRMS
jgi:hypothetical protein